MEVEETSPERASYIPMETSPDRASYVPVDFQSGVIYD